MDRFWSKVDKSGGPDACWPWLGGKQDNGYGHFFLCGRTLQASRVALFGVDVLNSEEHALHDCDNPPCCNPGHLHPGDNVDNTAEAFDRGRRLRGEQHPNSKLTDVEVLTIRKLYTDYKWNVRRLAGRFGIDYS